LKFDMPTGISFISILSVAISLKDEEDMDDG
jgi:hypothetical protein